MSAPTKDRIDEVFLFVADEGTGEGVVAFQTPDGKWMPLVAADSARLASLRPLALAISAKTGQPIKLLRFTTRTQVEVLDGRKGKQS